MLLNCQTVGAKQAWSGLVNEGQILIIRDIHGQQAVDFLCYDACMMSDRYSAANTIKVQGNIFIGKGTVLYADSGKPLMTVVEDTVGRHDTVYGCCSNPNNLLRYGVKTTESCYDNFTNQLLKYGLDNNSIVPNINWFMSVPVLSDGTAGVSEVDSQPGNFVKLRANCDILAILSNCPQMHNPCNGYNPTPIEVSIQKR